MTEKAVQNGKRALSGVAVGLATSLLGGGGGMIAVPALQKSGLDTKRAHATAILFILPVALVSFAVYVWHGIYDVSVLIPTAIGVSAGGFVGAKLLKKLPEKTVALVFSVLQAVAGITLFFFR